MRYECDEPAFAGDYVEFSDSWSRGQVKATWVAYGAWVALYGNKDRSDDELEVAEEKLLAQLRPKIIGLRLTCVDAEPITSAEDLTIERVVHINTILWGWWTGVWPKHLRGLADLGNALRLKLFDTSDMVVTVEAVPERLNHS